MNGIWRASHSEDWEREREREGNSREDSIDVNKFVMQSSEYKR